MCPHLARISARMHKLMLYTTGGHFTVGPALVRTGARRLVSVCFSSSSLPSSFSSFFSDQAHKDTQRAPNHFGSLLLFFPSVYTGGELQIRHAGQQMTVSAAIDESQDMRLVARSILTSNALLTSFLVRV